MARCQTIAPINTMHISYFSTPHIILFYVQVRRSTVSCLMMSEFWECGLIFKLTLGLLFGALWAKEAWGHYWTWDPKETWAIITWLCYLIYIHFRYLYHNKSKIALWILVCSFIILLICWFGINYISAAENSIHTYSG